MKGDGEAILHQSNSSVTGDLTPIQAPAKTQKKHILKLEQAGMKKNTNEEAGKLKRKNGHLETIGKGYSSRAPTAAIGGT